MVDWLWETPVANVTGMLLSLLALVLVTFVALRLLTVAARAVDDHFIAPVDDIDRRARLYTLRKVLKNGARVIILVTALLIALGTIGINIAPALAAAGIVGLAISLGAQTLIKDIIGGLTILLEDEYRVGDKVVIGSVSGDIERITLRRTDIRDSEGRLHMLPNGDVRAVANETREWARALVELNFAFDTDIRQAVAILQQALAGLAGDPRASPYLLAEPEIYGWNDFTDWSVVIRMRARVVASKHDDVARVMREYALDALQGAGVRVESCGRVIVPPSQ
jgi:moderate conductance mechanosensitive channel